MKVVRYILLLTYNTKRRYKLQDYKIGNVKTKSLSYADSLNIDEVLLPNVKESQDFSK